jgi:glyoxylase I family protein
MPNPILGGGGFHHVCVKTRDWEATKHFYCETLGFTKKIEWRTAPQRAALFDAGDGNYLEVFEDLAYLADPNSAILHLALRTTRLDAVATRVREAGLKITMEPKDALITPVNGPGPVSIRIFFCEGPSGEIVEFFQNSLT